MNVAFLRNNSPRERALSRAFRSGVSLHGDRFQEIDEKSISGADCDVMAWVGLKGRHAHEHCLQTGQRFLYLDKGYYYPEEGYASKIAKQAKNVKCWRVAVNDTQPLDYLATARHNLKRWDAFGPRPKEWRQPTPKGHIILAGSSPKYHQFNGLPHPTAYFEGIVAELRRYTNRPIHYRPKPSWWLRSSGECVPIAGTSFIPERPFEEHLGGAHAIITHGSNAALIGMLSGIPSIILGNGVMRVISSTDLSEVEEPRLASQEEKLQLLANIAHSQYNVDEFANGFAWRKIKEFFLCN